MKNLIILKCVAYLLIYAFLSYTCSGTSVDSLLISRPSFRLKDQKSGFLIYFLADFYAIDRFCLALWNNYQCIVASTGAEVGFIFPF
jgi:hypothetical protein